MKQHIEIEDLIAAARRQQADAKRQQQLCELVDRMAAEEQQKRRHGWWAAIGIAASIVLVFSIGHGIIDRTVTEELQGERLAMTEAVPVPEQTAEPEPAATAPSAATVRHTARSVAAAPEAGQTAEHEQDDIATEPVATPQAVETEEETPADAAIATPTAPQTEKGTQTVKVRSSKRMIRYGTKTSRKSEQAESPSLLAYFENGCSGTGTTIELGSWSL